MNKKVILNIIIILAIIIFALILLKIIDFGSNKTLVKHDTFNGYAFYSGYISEMSKRDTIKIISSYSSFKRYCDKYEQNTLLEKYSKEFFENQSLAIIYKELTSGSYDVEFISAIREENNVNIKTKVIYPEFSKYDYSGLLVTSDMSGCLIIVEVDKDIKDIV